MRVALSANAGDHQYLYKEDRGSYTKYVYPEDVKTQIQNSRNAQVKRNVTMPAGTASYRNGETPYQGYAARADATTENKNRKARTREELLALLEKAKTGSSKQNTSTGGVPERATKEIHGNFRDVPANPHQRSDTSNVQKTATITPVKESENQPAKSAAQEKRKTASITVVNDSSKSTPKTASTSATVSASSSKSSSSKDDVSKLTKNEVSDQSMDEFANDEDSVMEITMWVNGLLE